MDVNTSSKSENQSQISQLLHNFEEKNFEDIETITQILAKITSRTQEQIKPHILPEKG